MISDHESSDNQDHLLQHYHTLQKAILPAKEIITKNYQPDQTPQLKLVSLHQRRQVIPSIDANTELSQQQKKKYKIDFRQDDSLGYYLRDKIKNNLLYVKFDNKQFYTCPQNKYKYLAGFFASINLLLKPEIKQSQNLYQSLTKMNKLDYSTYEDKIDLSFKGNCLSTEKQIRFSSNYQSSNLFMALKNVKSNEYELVLQNDVNSKGTTQWFNFSVQFPQKGLFKFNIVNLTKSHSLFEKGMSIPLFSHINHQNHNKGWVRGCTNITYQINQILREGSDEQFYSTLHFQYENQNQGDNVTFSYGYPYTSIDMQKFFSKITQRKLSNHMVVERAKITQTLSGLPVYAYHIYPKKQMLSLHNLHRTQMNNFQTKFFNNPMDQQPKGIVFMSRQHPGQSQSSFILEGIIEFILQNNEYDNIKKSFHFYILPMVNVDGVFYGNYRTNLSGNDLNRIWKQPRKDFHPQVYAIKKYLYAANRMTEIKLIIDLHGHSSALNSFFYGNPMKKQGILQLQGQNSKLFPYFCSKQMKEISFVQSTFSISEDKKNSARVVLNEMFPKASVYTLETSFFGYKKGKRIVQFTIQKYKKLGRNFISTYFEYSKITQRVPLIKQKWQKQIELIQQKMKTLQITDVATNSDSQASQQLIEIEEQLQNNEIKQIQEIKEKSNQINQNVENNFFGQRSFNIHQRLYDRRKVKIAKFQTQESSKKSPFSRVVLHDSPESPGMNMTHLGFLSIVKIDTKNSISEKKEKGKLEQKITSIITGSGFHSMQMKQNQVQQGSNKEQYLKNTELVPKTEKIVKKEYSVRSFKQKINMIREKQQLQYINEKQYLKRRRKSLSRSIKLNEGHLGYQDSIFQQIKKRSIVHSKSSNALTNLKNKNKRLNFETTTILDVDEGENQN